ncbi:MAG: glycosyltransferase family 2 protein [Nitrospirae bacterium]|nr:glycosyltransferase family 2 protein [Nitrospirota bacterium]
MNIRVEISVIIPCYNHGEFLNEAIQSVLKSDFEEYEIIIVNDGSTDALTLEVFEELEREFENNQRVKIIHQDNLGLSAARNNGIKAAGGRYILPLDADNRIRPHYMSSAIKILDNNPELGVVYSYANFFGEKEGIWEFPEFDPQRLLLGNFVEACSVFRKRVWEECGGYDPRMRIGYEDWELWISAVEKGWKFHLIKEVLFDYRVRSNSMIAACNIPENRRYLIRHICNKHKDAYIENLDYVVSEKDVNSLALETHIRGMDTHVKNLEAIITDRNNHIGNLEAIITDKDNHIRNLVKDNNVHIEDLRKKDLVLTAIYNSRGWKVLSIYYRIKKILFRFFV